MILKTLSQQVTLVNDFRLICLLVETSQNTGSCHRIISSKAAIKSPLHDIDVGQAYRFGIGVLKTIAFC